MTLLPVDPPELGAPKGYHHGMLAPPGARILYVAGQTALGEYGVVSGDFVEQFGGALDRVLAVVTAAGGAPEDVGRMTVYVTDVAAYRAALGPLGEAWRARMGRHFPAMALVEVKALVDPAAVVEIEATAAIAAASLPALPVAEEPERDDLGPLTREYLRAAGRAEDDAPRRPGWAVDVERTLETLATHDQFELFRARARERQRPSTLAEATVGTLLLGCGFEIVGWGLQVAGRTPDILVFAPSGEPLYVEVKTPAVEEGRTRGAIFDAISEGASQLPTDQPTLVAIVPDLFLPPVRDVEEEAFEPSVEEFFRVTCPAHVGGALFLDRDEEGGEVIWHSRVFRNLCANEVCAIPDHVFDRIRDWED